MVRILAPLLLVGALLPAPVLAEDDPSVPTRADRDAVEQCIVSSRESGYTLDRCIGVVSDPCLQDEANQSTPMMGACLDKEATIWDDRLNASYKVLMQKLDADKKTALKTSQKAWIALRDQTCELEASFWDGGTGAGPASVACFLRETAHRALTLSGFEDYVTDQ